MSTMIEIKRALIFFLAFNVSKLDSARSRVRFVQRREDTITFPDEATVSKGEVPFFVSRGAFSEPGYYHSYEYHRKHPSQNGHIKPGQIVYEDGFVNGVDIGPRDAHTIPLEYARNLNNYNVSDLLLNFVEGDEEGESSPIIQDRFGGDEKNAPIVPKSAACIPELQTVQLASSTDASVLYIPQCTRIERCGGCCSHSLLSCQPKDTELVNMQVIKTKYVGGKKLKFVGKEVIQVEKHTKCMCDCKIKPEDCTSYQVYKKSECRCACTNLDEEKKCYKQNQTKLWDPEVCACTCREITECSTGYQFDSTLCKCVAVQSKRRYVEKRGYEYEALPFVPSNPKN